MKSKAKGVKQAETKVDPNRRPVDGRLAGGRPGNRVEPTLGRKEPAQNHPNSNSSRPTQDSRSKGGLKAPQGNFRQGAPQKRSKGPNGRRVTSAAQQHPPSRHTSGEQALRGAKEFRDGLGHNTLQGKPDPAALSQMPTQRQYQARPPLFRGNYQAPTWVYRRQGGFPAAGGFPYPGGATPGGYPYFGFPAHPGMGFY